MAEELSKGKSEGAPQEATARKEAPLQKTAAVPTFTKKGLVILGGVVLLEAALFMVFLFRGTKEGAHAEAGLASQEKESATAKEKDFEEFLKIGRGLLDLGEIKVPISSTQPRAPRSITAFIQVVVTKELLEKLSGGGGGHGGGGKSNPQKDVLVLNIRSILRSMMDSDGIRLIEPSAKNDFERRAKDRLNHVQIDGDEEKAQVLKVLRGHVLQVIIDKFDSQTY